MLQRFYSTLTIVSFCLILTGCSNGEGGVDNQNTTLSFLALGDSYTIGESVEADQKWPVQLSRALRKSGVSIENPKVIARTGWRTDDLIQAIEEEDPSEDYDVVSLLIGVNNQYQGKPISQYEQELEALLKTSIALTRRNQPSRVFVVSIPDYGYTPFGEAKKDTISLEIDNYNAINKEMSSRFNVWYFDITDISREGLDRPELVANDELHPSGQQYAEWVERILGNEEFVDYLRDLD